MALLDLNHPAVQMAQTMKQQGYHHNHIISTLQGQGYNPQQAFDVLSTADAAAAGQMPMPPGQGGYGGQGYDQGQGMPMPPGPDQYGGADQGGAQMFDSGGVDDNERIEEVAEAIIDEKWNDLLKDINKISEANQKMEVRMSKIEDDIKNLKENFDSLHRGVLGKISDYDRNLVNVGTEIKAMEKVFQKILPTFTDNVNKLSRLTQNVSAPRPQGSALRKKLIPGHRPPEHHEFHDEEHNSEE